MRWPVVLLPLLVGCGGSSYRIPQSHVDAPKNSIAAAEQQGVEASPAAARLNRAKKELAAAEASSKKGERRRADLLFLRADTDARLASAAARNGSASDDAKRIQSEAQRIDQQVRSMCAPNRKQ